ncbi:ABC transporter permease [Ensifer sp. NM-2]|uniref:ABC transporter permease n=1 Tax=Ensifer sp. NM-2 TaxID=2109730 RepID=UPI00211039F1|nr:ABC transporter permease [Ensifer sp. NM-2]
MLRDMRTRFGRSHASYLIAIAWPIVHLLVLVVIMAFVNRIAPIGGDPVVFVTSGVLAYILCFYPARAMGMALEMNRALFLFPVVKVFDVIVARAVVEFVTSFIVVTVVFVSAGLSGIDLLPLDKFTLASGIVAIIYFSISLGFVNVVLSSIFRMWNIVFIFMMLGMYMTSGLFAVPSSMPTAMRELVWYNPLLHAIEWIRSAYYEGYGDEMLSKAYFLSLGTIFLFLGLLGERFMRGKLLTG